MRAGGWVEQRLKHPTLANPIRYVTESMAQHAYENNERLDKKHKQCDTFEHVAVAYRMVRSLPLQIQPNPTQLNLIKP